MRIKKVFSTYDETAHVWAAQTQPDGRSVGRRMFFDGRHIYSYGHHFEIARFEKVGKADVVLFTTRDYSNTTSKHKRAVDDAVTHKRVFYVPTFKDANANVDYYITKINDEIQKLRRSHTLGLLTVARNDIKHVAEYVEVFGKQISADRKRKVRRLSNSVILTPEEIATIERRCVALKERNTKRTEERRARWERQSLIYKAEAADRVREREEKIKRDRENLTADRARWQAGEDVDNEFLNDGPVMLRITETDIETSRFARIPLIEARKFWHTLQRRETVVGMRLGYYTVDSLDAMTLTVGCHSIPLKEVLKMARLLKWDDGKTLEVQP